MTKFIPTKEQMFDYHLGLTDPELTRQINAYFKANPQEKSILEDYTHLETQFSHLPLEEPNEMVLERVRKMAAKQAKKSLWDSIKESFLVSFPVPKLARVTTMIFVIVGLSYALNQLQKTENIQYGTQAPVAKNAPVLTDNTNMANKTQIEKNSHLETNTEATNLNPDINQFNNKTTAANFYYTKGIAHFRNNEFEKSCEFFQKTLESAPRFKKRVELYTHWIKALNELGQNDLAHKKSLELDQIKRGETP